MARHAGKAIATRPSCASAAIDRIDASPLSKREIIRRLGTSPAQFYRLIDPTDYRKSVDKMLALLQMLDWDVEVIVRAKSA